MKILKIMLIKNGTGPKSCKTNRGIMASDHLETRYERGETVMITLSQKLIELLDKNK